MLRLKRFSEGVWFDYPKGGRFKIRPILPKDYLDIREKCKRGKDDYNEAEITFKIFEWMLEAWEDIEIENATTPEQVRETIFNHMDIANWIGEKSREISQKEQDKLDGELKNFATSQSGLPPKGRPARTVEKPI